MDVAPGRKQKEDARVNGRHQTGSGVSLNKFYSVR